MRPKGIEKLAYVFLKENDEGYYAHANQLVENASKQAHLEHLAHQQPYQHKEHDADEDVERARLFHQSVEIIEHQCH